MASINTYVRAGRLLGFLQEGVPHGSVSLRLLDDSNAFLFEWYFEKEDRKFRQQFAVESIELNYSRLSIQSFSEQLLQVWINGVSNIGKYTERNEK